MVRVQQLQSNNKYNSKITLQYIFTFYNNNQRHLKPLRVDQSLSALVIIIITITIIHSHIYGESYYNNCNTTTNKHHKQHCNIYLPSTTTTKDT